MTDKKIKDFTKGIEEIAKLHPADQEKEIGRASCRERV